LARRPETITPYIVPKVQVRLWEELFPVFLANARELEKQDDAALATSNNLIALYVGPIGAHVLGRREDFKAQFQKLWQSANASKAITKNRYLTNELALMGSYAGCSEHLLSSYVEAPELLRRQLVGGALLLIDSRLHGDQRRKFVVRMVRDAIDYRDYAKPNLWVELSKRLLWWLQTKGVMGSPGIALMLSLWRDEIRRQRARGGPFARQAEMLDAQLSRRRIHTTEVERALAPLPPRLRSQILNLWLGEASRVSDRPA
jgi:hypothetical protein